MMDWKEKNGLLYIKIPENFSFNVNHKYLQERAEDCMFEVVGSVIRLVVSVNQLQTLVEISDADVYLSIKYLAGDLPKSLGEKEEVVKYIYEWFDMSVDLSPFYEMAGTDSLLHHPVQQFHGLRVIGIPDLFEALCWGVIGQQINLTFAYRLKRQFVEAFGEAIIYEGKSYWSFPAFETIAKLTVADMSHIKMTLRKTEYIIDIAKRMNEGELTKTSLLKIGNLAEAEKELIKIRGVGPWTAHYVLMRCLRFRNAFPIDDVGLLNAIKFQMGMSRKPTKNEVKEMAKHWVGWEAYATFYLWRTLY